MKSNELTSNDILRHSKNSGEISYINTNDSLGLHEINTDERGFLFSSGEDKSHAKELISDLLVNDLIRHESGVFYRITKKGYAVLTTNKSTQKSKKVTQSKINNEDIFELKPNFFGIGINLNALCRWYYLRR